MLFKDSIRHKDPCKIKALVFPSDSMYDEAQHIQSENWYKDRCNHKKYEVQEILDERIVLGSWDFVLIGECILVKRHILCKMEDTWILFA